MSLSRKLAFIAALLVQAGFALAQDATMPAELADKAERYRDVLREQVAVYRKTTEQQPQLYFDDIKALGERLQKSGDLEGYLAADKELKRFSAAMASDERDPFELTPEMPESAMVAEPAELRARQELYLKRFSDADQARKKNIEELTAKYLAHLKELQKDLTIKNRIEDAVAVKKEADKIQKAFDSGSLVALAESFADAHADSPAAETAETAVPKSKPAIAEEDIPTFGHIPTWTYWKFQGVKTFAQEGMLLGHPDIPDELDGDWDGKRNRGYVKGRCKFDHAVVDMFERSWLGKAFIWQVNDPAQLSATIELDSAELSTGKDSGPHARLALLGPDKKVLKAISVPLMSKSATLRIGYKKDENRCAINWQQGKTTESVILQDKGPYFILLGICVRQPGEECNTTFSMK